MGSLMAGWGSPVSDPTTVICERNRSLTKEEIEAYWKSKKQTEEEHLKAILLQQAPFEEYERKYMRSKSNTLPNTVGWRRSDWAFLNEYEPPVVERPTNSSYKPQFHIEKLAASGV